MSYFQQLQNTVFMFSLLHLVKNARRSSRDAYKSQPSREPHPPIRPPGGCQSNPIIRTRPTFPRGGCGDNFPTEKCIGRQGFPTFKIKPRPPRLSVELGKNVGARRHSAARLPLGPRVARALARAQAYAPQSRGKRRPAASLLPATPNLAASRTTDSAGVQPRLLGVDARVPAARSREHRSHTRITDNATR